MIRPARDADAAGLIALIEGCWAEYPGCIMDLDGEVPELRALATHYAACGGAAWVAEEGGIVGCVGIKPAWEIGRMYVAAAQRGTGLAQLLLATAEGFAPPDAALCLWTDTRFTRAHRFYARAGYAPTGRVRDLHDVSSSRESEYVKQAKEPR